MLVEDVLRLELPQIKEGADWSAITEAGWVSVTIRAPKGEAMAHRLQLTTDRTVWGRRWWFICPAGCGRKCLHLYVTPDGALSCRQCWNHGKGLLYFQQTLTARFREEVGVHALRCLRSHAHKKGRPS